MRFEPDLVGKRALVIGSGEDLNHRQLASWIDNEPNLYVIRCNKFYGLPERVGTRTHVRFVRQFSWGDKYFPPGLRGGQVVSIFEDTPKQWRRDVARAARVRVPSCGLLAVEWAYHCCADAVSLIGFGYPAQLEKRYPNGEIDDNLLYDWQAEYQYLKNVALCDFVPLQYDTHPDLQ